MAVQSDELAILTASKARQSDYPNLSRRAQRRLLTLALLACDGLMLGLAFLAAYWLRFEAQVALQPEVAPSIEFYSLVVAVLVPVWLLLFFLFKLYDYQSLLGGTEEYAHVFYACTVGIMLVVTATFIQPEFVIARGWLVVAWLLTFLFVALARFSLRRVVYYLRRKGYFVVPGLIVGSNDEAVALAQQLAAWRTSGIHLLGLVSDQSRDGHEQDDVLPVLGGLDSLAELVQRHQVEELIVAASAVSSEQLLELFRRYGVRGDIHLRLSSGLFDVFTTGLKVTSLAYVPLISAEKVRLSRVELAMKAGLDYLGASLGLILLSPLLVAIAVAIKLDSPGPSIYRRRVLGRGGREFDAYKFRTMYVDGDSRLSPEQLAELQDNHKLRDDPRVTRVGRLLRKTSLDEMPQLVNVLRGQMSLIGPRMITPAEREKYGKWDMNLLTVKPGMSGLWQVSGRSDLGYEERVRLDMQYIRNYTIWLDLHLILRTIGVVIRGKGAY